MPVVIEEVESTVEPAGSRRQPGGEPESKQEKSKNLTMDEVATELRRMERRMLRLRAD